jgi:hypothetical protein
MPERPGYQLRQCAPLFLDHQVVRRLAGADRPDPRTVHHLQQHRDQVAFAHRDDGVEVRVAAGIRQVDREHLRRRASAEQ